MVVGEGFDDPTVGPSLKCPGRVPFSEVSNMATPIGDNQLGRRRIIRIGEKPIRNDRVVPIDEDLDRRFDAIG